MSKVVCVMPAAPMEPRDSCRSLALAAGGSIAGGGETAHFTLEPVLGLTLSE